MSSFGLKFIVLVLITVTAWQANVRTFHYHLQGTNEGHFETIASILENNKTCCSQSDHYFLICLKLIISTYHLWVICEISNTHFFVCSLSIMNKPVYVFMLRGVSTFNCYFISLANFYWRFKSKKKKKIKSGK